MACVVNRWDDARGYRNDAPAVPRACTTCGISAPAHDEAIAVGLVRAHAWTGSADPNATPSTTSESGERQ